MSKGFFPLLIKFNDGTKKVCESNDDIPIGIAFTVEETNHSQARKRFDIWCEGYAATGEQGGAHYFGAVRAENFREACVTFFYEHPDLRRNFDSGRLSYWGCKLFSCERAARESFG